MAKASYDIEIVDLLTKAEIRGTILHDPETINHFINATLPAYGKKCVFLVDLKTDAVIRDIRGAVILSGLKKVR